MDNGMMVKKFVDEVGCPLCKNRGNIPYRYEKRTVCNTDVELGHNLCRNCGLQYVSPRLNNKALSLLYDKEYHTATVSGLYNVNKDVSKQEYVTFTKYIKKFLGNSGCILDVGCGVGNLLQELKMSTDIKCAGVEVSKQAATIAKENNLEVFNGPLQGADFVSEKFEAVALLYVLEHVNEPLDILKEIHRVLKPGGYLFLAVPNYRYLHLAYESIFSKLITGSLTLHPEEHLQNFTPVTLKKIVEKAGFKLVLHQCARPLVIGSSYVKFVKNSMYYLVKVLSLMGYNIGGIHFILKKL